MKMAYLILRILINALSIVAAVKLIHGITFAGEWWKMLAVGAIFGIVNSVIKPAIQFFTFPFIIFSLGLFTFIINALMLLVTASLSDAFNLGLKVGGFCPAVKGALIISLVSMLLSFIAGTGRVRVQRFRHPKDDNPAG